MTLSLSPRLLLQRWSADSDPQNRAQFDDAFAKIDAGAMMFVEVTASNHSDRPAAGKHGRLARCAVHGEVWWDDGSAWDIVVDPTAWSTYTPTFTGLNVGGTAIVTYKYKQVGKTVNVIGKVNLQATSSVTGTIIGTFPVPAAAQASGVLLGIASMDDASSGFGYDGSVFQSTTTKWAIRDNHRGAAEANWSDTSPVAWGSMDAFYTTFTYEAA